MNKIAICARHGNSLEPVHTFSLNPKSIEDVRNDFAQAEKRSPGTYALAEIVNGKVREIVKL